MSGARPKWALLTIGLFLGAPLPCLAITTPVHVLLDGSDAAGAEVFVDSQLRGKTDLGGILNIDRALLVDHKTVITARRQVYETPAFLAGHEDAASPSGWVMRVYVTNVEIDNSGKVTRFVVANKTVQQELVLKRDNALIGLQVLASADWDMSKADFARLIEAFQVASQYLWNATDGQFVFEHVKIADQAQHWDRSEYRLWADNTPRPRTNPGGYLNQNSLGLLVGSYITLPWRDSIIHLQDSPGYGGGNPRTFVHEFGHLGFSLKDEYSDVSGETCTVRRSTDAAGTPFGPYGEKSACVMDSQFESAKFCSDQGPNSHNYTSQQPDDCWAGIRGSFSDPQGARWILKTPVTRNQIVGTLKGASGTANDAFPQEWNTGFTVTNKGWPTAVCKPFLQTVLFVDGSTASLSTVKLLYTSIDPSQNSWISEGKTLSNGTLAILGAHVGDTVMTETAFNTLTVCPNGTWTQGALGVSEGDADGDHVPDAFDTCPNRFNPYQWNSGIEWVSQPASSCGCSANADCGRGLVCASGSGGSGPQCVVPSCRADDDCGAGKRCSGKGSDAQCTDIVGSRCKNNADCGKNQCDVGDGTSKTGFCVPKSLSGQPGTLCTNDNQCVFAICDGLTPDAAGGWRPGHCGDSQKKPLGDYCSGHPQCASGYCDAGNNTSKTNRCMPNHNGLAGDICSDNGQCTSGNCGGLVPIINGGWKPGTCSANSKKPLGDYCFGSNQCDSGYCDTGFQTSQTDRCMPNRDGQFGQICTQDNQCASLNCSNLINVGALVPGTCGAKKALGVSCSAHTQCSSAYCDGGNNTSNTYRCMPFQNGVEGDICSNDTQCNSLNCAGLTQTNGAWVPGTCSGKRALGVSCSANNQCNSAFCDVGNNTSHTGLCMPNMNGQIGNSCSNDNQCSSNVCAGLAQNASGQWTPGQCASKKALGDSCSQNYQCSSSYCDSGNNTSRTDRCMPNTNGKSGDICSHDNQCTSRVCVGLHAQGNNWIPGQCR